MEELFVLGRRRIYFRATTAAPRGGEPLLVDHRFHIDDDGDAVIEGRQRPDTRVEYALRRLLADKSALAHELGISVRHLSPLARADDVASLTAAMRALDGDTDVLARYARYLTRYTPLVVPLLAARMHLVGVRAQPLWPRDAPPPDATLTARSDEPMVTWEAVTHKPLPPPRLRQLGACFPLDDESRALLYAGARPLFSQGVVTDVDASQISALLKVLYATENDYETMSMRERTGLVFALALCGIATDGALAMIAQPDSYETLGIDDRFLVSVAMTINAWAPRGAAPALTDGLV